MLVAWLIACGESSTPEPATPSGGEVGAVIHTSVGPIRCALWPRVAPKTVDNFVGLATGTREWTDPRTGAPRTDPLYNGTVFHRILPGFMIQGGDPLGTGTGGPGYRFEDEVSPEVTFDRGGLLAMANSGPGTNGSQFFVTTRDSMPEWLNGRHTIFGACDVEMVELIASRELTFTDGPRPEKSVPVDPVVLQHIEIERR